MQRRTKMIINKEVTLRKDSQKRESFEPRLSDSNKSAELEASTKMSSEKEFLVEDNIEEKSKVKKNGTLNEISDEIINLIGEAKDNLNESSEDQREKEKMEHRNPDFMEILNQVEKLLPAEKEGENAQKDDDAYFNFVSSKSFHLRRDSEFRNKK